MNDQEKLRIIEEARRLVHELDGWADEKLTSGTPASAREQALIDEALSRIAGLKQAVKNLATEP